MHDAFLSAIIDAPEDDTPRLVYADWLDENGEPERAEFIRTQCRTARQAVPAIADELRADDLLDAHGHAWRAGLPTLDGIRWKEFERGFPTWAEADDLATFTRHAEALSRTTARKLRFYWDDDVEKEALPEGWAGFAGMAGLVFEFWTFDAAETARLAASHHAGGLESLAIRYSDFDAASMAVLAASPNLARLRHLDLTNHLVAAEGIRALGRSSTLTGLRHLNLSHDDLADEEHNLFDTNAMTALAGAETLRHLHTLKLCPYTLTREGCAALAGSPHLRGLRSLALASGELEGGALEALHDSALLAGLEKLDLRDLHVTLADLRSLLRSPRPPGLFTMALDVEWCGADGIRALLASAWAEGLTELLLGGRAKDGGEPPAHALSSGVGSLGKLEQLYLRELNVDDGVLLALTRGGLDRLASLHLSYTATVTEEGLRAFAESPGLPALRRLRFSGPCLGGMVVDALAGTALASRLLHLDLSHQRLRPGDIEPFLARTRWPRLTRLNLSRNVLGERAAQALRDCWGEAVVLDGVD